MCVYYICGLFSVLLLVKWSCWFFLGLGNELRTQEQTQWCYLLCCISEKLWSAHSFSQLVEKQYHILTYLFKVFEAYGEVKKWGVSCSFGV